MLKLCMLKKKNKKTKTQLLCRHCKITTGLVYSIVTHCGSDLSKFTDKLKLAFFWAKEMLNCNFESLYSQAKRPLSGLIGVNSNIILIRLQLNAVLFKKNYEKESILCSTSELNVTFTVKMFQGSSVNPLFESSSFPPGGKTFSLPVTCERHQEV